MNKEEIFAIIDDELEKRKLDTFLLWDFPNAVKKRIEELYQSEDNTNPSEALETVRKYESSNYLDVWHPKFVKGLQTVEQALLKAQEQEKENAELKRILDVIKEHFNFRFQINDDINGKVYSKLVYIQAKEDDDTTASNIEYYDDFDLLKRYFK